MTQSKKDQGGMVLPMH